VKLSRQTKEIIQIVVFLVVAALLVIAFIIYPLGQVKDQFARTDIDDYDNNDTVIVNDPAVWIDHGLPVDTFKVESDGLTVLACLILQPDSLIFDSAAGTVVLIPDERYNRDSVMSLAEEFHNAGYVVITYDQRATGHSTGKYHGEGRLETDDLLAVISYADLRTWIRPPLTVVGEGLGGDAGIMAAPEDERIKVVVAFEPHLTTERYLVRLKQRHEALWLPFYQTIIYWWYGMRSSYASEFREADQLQPLAGPTLIIAAEPSDEALDQLEEQSGDKLELKQAVNPVGLFDLTLEFIGGTPPVDSTFSE